jgi:hypothetical protein
MIKRCPYHQTQFCDEERPCALCVRDGLEVIVCEVDKIRRVLDTMHEQGAHLQPHSFATLIFKQRDTVAIARGQHARAH